MRLFAAYSTPASEVKSSTRPQYHRLQRILELIREGSQADKPWKVRLLFAREVATYIHERVWHGSQELRRRRDGTLEFRLQTSSRTELTRWILSWMRMSECLLRANSGSGCGNECVRDWLAADDPCSTP